MRKTSLFLALFAAGPAAARAEAVGFIESIQNARETLRFDSTVVADPLGVWRIEGFSGEIPVSAAWGHPRRRIHY